MRLWHQDLLPSLSTLRLQGQHRECCALRGLGWGRKHSTVNYVFTWPREYLVAYHWIVMDLLRKSGIRVNPVWDDPTYRGLRAPRDQDFDGDTLNEALALYHINNDCIYPEHNAEYRQECVALLKARGEPKYQG